MGLMFPLGFIVAAMVAMAIILSVISVILLIIAALFFIAAKKSVKGKKKKILYIVSAVFATPAAFFAEAYAGGAVSVNVCHEKPEITAFVLLWLLCLFIIGVITPRVKLVFRILYGLPWVLCAPCIIYLNVLSEISNLPDFLDDIHTYVAISLIITYGSAFLIYRSHRRNTYEISNSFQ